MPGGKRDRIDTFEKLAVLMVEGFEQVGARLDSVEGRLDGIDSRLNAIEDRLEHIEPFIRETK